MQPSSIRAITCLAFTILMMGLAPKAPAQTKFYQYYQKGLDYLKDEDTMRALDHFQSAASLSFEDKKRKRIYGTRFIKYYPHYQMARIYFDLGEFDNTRRELDLSLAFANSKDARKLLEKLGDRGQAGEGLAMHVETPPTPDTEYMSIPEDSPTTPEETPTRTEPPDATGLPEAQSFIADPPPPTYERTYDPNVIPRVGQRLSMAVLPFTQEGGSNGLTSQVTDEMVNQLVNLRRFTILERNALDKLLDEQALGMSGLIDEDKAVEAGRMAGADAIVIGTLILSSGYTKVHAKVIDTETSETLAARDRNSTSAEPKDLDKEIANLALLIYNDLPLVMGNVVEFDEHFVYLDLGRNMHMRNGMKCIVFREGKPVLHPKTGEILGVRRELITELVITQVQEKMSIAKVIEDTGDGDIAVGDRVVLK